MYSDVAGTLTAVDPSTDTWEHTTIPGWSSLFENITENVEFEFSTEKVHSGDQSLKLIDNK